MEVGRARNRRIREGDNCAGQSFVRGEWEVVRREKKKWEESRGREGGIGKVRAQLD